MIEMTILGYESQYNKILQFANTEQGKRELIKEIRDLTGRSVDALNAYSWLDLAFDGEEYEHARFRLVVRES